jgi:hypothetical protein
LIVDFYPPELWRSIFLLFCLPLYGWLLWNQQQTNKYIRKTSKCNAKILYMYSFVLPDYRICWKNKEKIRKEKGKEKRKRLKLKRQSKNPIQSHIRKNQTG